VLLAVNLEEEFVGTILGKVGDLGLRRISMNNHAKPQKGNKEKICLPS
jgi:hypothetical protein